MCLWASNFEFHLKIANNSMCIQPTAMTQKSLSSESDAMFLRPHSKYSPFEIEELLKSGQ
jgi:hypothetical protein